MLTAGNSTESPSRGAVATFGVDSTDGIGSLVIELACAPSRGASVVDALFSARGVVPITGTAEGADSTVGDE